MGMLLMCAGAVVLSASCIVERETPGANLAPGDSVPEFSVEMNDGSTFNDDMLDGKVSVIAFFHTMCSDCANELPVLQRFYDDFGDKVTVICISRAEGYESVSSYWSEHSLTLPFSAQDDAALYKKFATSAIPRLYIVDRDKVIRKVFDDNPVATYEDIVTAVSTL